MSEDRKDLEDIFFVHGVSMRVRQDVLLGKLDPWDVAQHLRRIETKDGVDGERLEQLVYPARSSGQRTKVLSFVRELRALTADVERAAKADIESFAQYLTALDLLSEVAGDAAKRGARILEAWRTLGGEGRSC